ncbi:MAG TPA: hypothetical protein VMU38_09100 [Candidatus Binatia bacterium]|nr:hypothetical protein [Candidatus Binatia bacterium]
MSTPTPGPVYWYYENSPTPSPYPSAWAAINGAFAAGIVYNTGTGGSGSLNGLDVVDTGLCNFLCFGKRGTKSSAVFVLGNDHDTAHSTSLTILGAPDDCTTHCPGGVQNNVYGITLYENGSNTYLAAVDGSGNLGIYNNVIAGATIVAGGTPYPSPTASGSLISHTGAGKGELLLGGSANYVRCDYGETTASVLTCNAPVTVTAPLMAAESASSSTGPVSPCYDHDGTACGSAFHTVKNTSDPMVTTNGSCAPNSWCGLTGNSIALSSAGQFTSSNYTCALSSSSTYQLSLMVNNQSTTGFTIQAYNIDSSGRAIVSGTNLKIQYACSGN